MNGVKAEVTHWYPNRRQRNQKRDLQECLIDCGGYRFRIYFRERLDHNSSSAGYDLWISDTASHNACESFEAASARAIAMVEAVVAQRALAKSNTGR